MTQPAPPRFVPAIDESKVPSEVALHLRLLYDKAQNHFQAINNLQAQVTALQAQLNKAQGK
jgi:hypothetical protein